MASRHFSRRLDGRKRDRAGVNRYKRDATQPGPLCQEYVGRGPPEFSAKTRLEEVLDENGIASLPQLSNTK
jgi:hypothetical protein